MLPNEKGILLASSVFLVNLSSNVDAVERAIGIEAKEVTSVLMRLPLDLSFLEALIRL